MPRFPRNPEKKLTPMGEIAQGGQGEVSLHFDDKSGIYYVKKQVKPGSESAEENRINRLQREFACLQILSHPKVPQPVGRAPEYDPKAHFWMNHIIGMDGQELIDLNPEGVPHVLALNITLKVAEIVESCLSQRILHRDIKPANIICTPLLKDYYDVHLCDFGSAKLRYEKWTEPLWRPFVFGNEGIAQADFTQYDQLIGTAYYMDPQRITNALDESSQGDKSDIYSLGITLYHFLTGKVPFHNDNQKQEEINVSTILRKQLHEELDLTGLPDPIQKLLQAMCAKTIEERLSSIRNTILMISRTIRQITAE